MHSWAVGNMTITNLEHMPHINVGVREHLGRWAQWMIRGLLMNGHTNIQEIDSLFNINLMKWSVSYTYHLDDPQKNLAETIRRISWLKKRVQIGYCCCSRPLYYSKLNVEWRTGGQTKQNNILILLQTKIKIFNWTLLQKIWHTEL